VRFHHRSCCLVLLTSHDNFLGSISRIILPISSGYIEMLETNGAFSLVLFLISLSLLLLALKNDLVTAVLCITLSDILSCHQSCSCSFCTADFEYNLSTRPGEGCLPCRETDQPISSTCHYISFLLLIGIFDVGSEIKMADSHSENVNHGGIHLDHLWTVRHQREVE
jgi:hypothetical protein